jgi:hypothetical protein
VTSKQAKKMAWSSTHGVTRFGKPMLETQLMFEAAKAREDELCAQLQRLVKKFRECVDCETPGNLVRLTLEVARAEELLRIR